MKRYYGFVNDLNKVLKICSYVILVIDSVS